MGKTNKIEMVNKTFGNILVLSEVEKRNKNGSIMYKVKCSCGKEKEVLGSSLRSGKSTSCGRCSKITHGMDGTNIYKCWISMKSRCYNKNTLNYKKYGYKGITVCSRWITSFENFYKDMGDVEKGMSIDRINVYGNYEPSNCRWATPKEQANNRTNNKKHIYKGIEYNQSELCRKFSIKTNTFTNRLNRGWSLEDALNRKIEVKHRININGTFVKDN